MPLDVWRARTVVEGPAPRVMGAPLGVRVEPAMTYWDCGFGVMVSVPMVRGAGAGVKGRRVEVVRIWEPAALVVVRIMAGRWAVEEVMTPWAFVEVMVVGRYAEIGAVERLVVVTMLP